MPSGENEQISELARLALASAKPADRDVWRSFFALDFRLAEIVAKAREPLLAQMRLAWWRSELGKTSDERARGDPTLDSLSRFWHGEEGALIDLIDGWEGLLSEEPHGADVFQKFARGRGAVCAAIARLIGCEADATAAAGAGEIWALAELGARARGEKKREAALLFALPVPRPAPMNRSLRPLAVIGGLSRRALARGGAALIGDRLSPLVAFRLGILGR